MYVRIIGQSQGGGNRLNLRCPNCHQHGTFAPMNNIADLRVKDYWLGQRGCPNQECSAHIFFVANDGFKVLRTYPALRIDFDTENIPDSVANTLSQAITCHSEECYIAAGIMVRRCLEELCADRGAEGNSLKERLKNLTGKILIPAELVTALDDLRLLGNDAAHVEAKTFGEVGKDEIDASIEVAKEILKAVYQMDSLVKRLRALKKDTGDA